MFRSDYCCLAVPLYNVGIYAILAQFAVIGLIAGILAVASPSVLAIAVPSFLTVVFGVLCILVAALQVFGFWGVYKEKATAFRKYVRVNISLVAVAAALALAIIVVSATRHSTAVSACLVQFGSSGSNSTASASGEVIQGRSLCNVWTWAQLGVCGFLFALVVASEVYFCLMERIWGSEQRRDHMQYRSIVSATRDSYALRPSADWDSSSRRPSTDRADAVDLPELRRGPTSNTNNARSGLRNEVAFQSFGEKHQPSSEPSSSREKFPSPYRHDATALPPSSTTAYQGYSDPYQYPAYRSRPAY